MGIGSTGLRRILLAWAALVEASMASRGAQLPHATGAETIRALRCPPWPLGELDAVGAAAIWVRRD